MSRIKLLIVDDSTLLRRLLAYQLSCDADFEVVGDAADGREAIELALELRPDVVVMDLDMPLVNGAQATQRILAQQPGVQVLLLTSFESLAPIGRSSGASECLNKGCTPQELATAIRRVRAAKGSDPAEQGTSTDHRIAIERLAARAALTDREKSVLERIVASELTVHQIARALSAESRSQVTDSSVKHTLERVMTKLQIEPRCIGKVCAHVRTERGGTSWLRNQPR
jgi:DNA-binding NarL/FixJ family response regulator